MPSKNIYKTYVKDGYYHIYNRGVEKRKIFLDETDYKVFLNNLKIYLTSPPKPEEIKIPFTLQGTTFKGIRKQPKNYKGQIDLLAYCLMPNHFHLIIKQSDSCSIQKFMQSLTVKYSMYFNKKYKRVGQLFQSRFKAVLITEDAYLLHLSRYIHLNPSEYTDNLVEAYSSFGEYIRLRNTEWIKPDIILKYFESQISPEFKKYSSYSNFVEGYKKDGSEIPDELTLER